MISITVANKHHGAIGEYIGRGSPLGNPFSHIPTGTHAKYVVATRADAIEKYALWLQEQVHKQEPRVIAELNRLAYIALEQPLTLVCFCKPKACHGDIIKSVLLSAIQEHTQK